MFESSVSDNKMPGKIRNEKKSVFYTMKFCDIFVVILFSTGYTFCICVLGNLYITRLINAIATQNINSKIKTSFNVSALS